MDCCICGPMAATYRPPRNTICHSCYEGARRMDLFLRNLEDGNDGSNGCNQSNRSHLNSFKGLSDVFRWMENRKGLEEGLKEKIDFLGAHLFAFREEIHTDIVIKPRTGPPIPAHKALLATRSEIFRTMLGSDDCKAPAEDTIGLPDLNHEEVRCLLEFLYAGTLPEELAEAQVYTLLLAADKYEIPPLKKQCERRLLGSLSPSNVLDVLEVAAVCSSATLKQHAMRVVEKHADDVVFSGGFEGFALKNPHLCVEITRMLVRDENDKKNGGILG